MIKRLLVSVALAIGLTVVAIQAEAKADPEVCRGNWSLGIGGLQLSLATGSWEDSSYLVSDQPVAYDSLDPVSGLAELDRLYWRHRAQCPGDHVTILGHSEGSGIAHAWISANSWVDQTDAVLLADPKQAPNGLSGHQLGAAIGYPLAGTDSDFGSVPVRQVCNLDDVVCNMPAGWVGYLFTRAHVSYDMNANNYK